MVYFLTHSAAHHAIPSAADIIDEERIHTLLESTKEAAKDVNVIRGILERAREASLLTGVTDPGSEYIQAMNLEEAATLLNVDPTNKAIMQELFDTALEIKRRIYGNRIVLFAPLYLSNYCINSCTYCGYRLPNKDAKRKIITQSELEAEVAALQHQGHRRVLLLTGEHPKYPFSKFIKALETVRDIKTEPHGSIRRINVEIPPLSISDFRKLCATDCVGTYTVFQESYHQETYKRTHPAGPKADYEWRLTCMDRVNLGEWVGGGIVV
jgi:2-iminoacetate synthase ThiH